jgi:hypothetical protein
MRRILAGAMIVCLSASATWAGPKDKSKETLIDSSSINGNGTTWNNNTVQANVKSGKCKIKIGFKDTLPALEGQVIYCFGEADVRATSLGAGTFGNSAVLSGTVADGQLKISADLSAAGCGVTSAAVAFNGTMSCYTDPGSDYNWEDECVNAAPLMLPLAGDGGGLLGVCQSTTAGAGQRIPKPGLTLLVVQGSSQPIAP